MQQESISACFKHSQGLTLLTRSCSLLCSTQKPRQGPSVPDFSRLHPRHTHRRGPLPASEEGPEPTDDRGVPRQQQEALQ